MINYYLNIKLQGLKYTIKCDKYKKKFQYKVKIGKNHNLFVKFLVPLVPVLKDHKLSI